MRSSRSDSPLARFRGSRFLSFFLLRSLETDLRQTTRVSGAFDCECAAHVCAPPSPVFEAPISCPPASNTRASPEKYLASERRVPWRMRRSREIFPASPVFGAFLSCHFYLSSSSKQDGFCIFHRAVTTQPTGSTASHGCIDPNLLSCWYVL